MGRVAVWCPTYEMVFVSVLRALFMFNTNHPTESLKAATLRELIRTVEYGRGEPFSSIIVPLKLLANEHVAPIRSTKQKQRRLDIIYSEVMVPVLPWEFDQRIAKVLNWRVRR